MEIVSLDEAKKYLRVDYPDEDELIRSLIASSQKICLDVARLEGKEIKPGDETLRIAVLYCLAYIFEHRESADYHELALTLRALLFGVRREAF